MSTLHVSNEYGSLKKVLVFRPGPEVESCFPGPLALEPYHIGKWYWPLKAVQGEFDSFLDLLKGADVEILDVRQLLRDVVVSNPGAVLQEVLGSKLGAYLDYHHGTIPEATSIVEDLVVGLPRTFAGGNKIIGPLQYATWVRDWGTVLGNSVFLWPVIERRRPAAAVLRAIVNHHEIFSGSRVYDYVDSEDLKIEGGDVLMLNKDIVAIGIGPRTTKESAVQIAEDLIKGGIVRQVYIIEIPNLFEVIHLDQVLAMIGPKTVLATPFIFDEPEPYGPMAKTLSEFIASRNGKALEDLPFGLKGHRLYVADKGGVREGNGLLEQLRQDGIIEEVLWAGGFSDVYSAPMDHFRAALVETARQAANVLTTSPWNIVAYADASPRTQSGIWQGIVSKGGSLNTFAGSWLIQGKGGPHCLTMPLERA